MVLLFFQVSASRADIEEAEENAVPDQQAEEGLFDMVTNCAGLPVDCLDFDLIIATTKY